MNENTIFTVEPGDLANLGSDLAVAVFRELLWAEATALGIGKHLINVPTAITVADGGVDAEIRDVPIQGGQGMIKPGLTCYQIKTGEYSLRKKNNRQTILFTPRSKGTALEPRVKACLDKDGTLVIVLFGWDKPETREGEYVDLVKDELTQVESKYENANIEVWQPNQLIGFLKPFPSLALKLKGLEGAAFQTYRSWADNEDMQGSFEKGEEQIKRIAALQTALRRDDGAVHVHVMGEPGIGKTRHVLEAAGAVDLAPLVIYCSDAGVFKNSNLMYELLREDNHSSAILVLDECDEDDRSYIWNRLKRRGSRIKLISIHSDFTTFSGSTLALEIPSLQKSQISNIIQSYGIVADQADRWSELCSGSPRVAHVIGWNLKNSPEDLLRPMDTFPLWDRYIIGGDKRDREEVKQRRLVLRYLALFKRFGYRQPLDMEAVAIAKLIEEADPRITYAKFQEIVKTLQVRKILQGSHTLYITPKALHIKLWADWWETYGDHFRLDTFSSGVPGALLEWFYEMFVYAANSQAALSIVQRLLGEDGPFQHNDYLQTKLGAHFFFALAQASPEAALACLKRTVGTWSEEKLQQFTVGRREIIWALERIAMWRPLFADASRLLLALGEAENESWANNASGVFVELFAPGPGEVAPTQASPLERLPVLREALQSPSKRRRQLAINACAKALESQHFSRAVGAEYQGLRLVPDLWMPATYGEIFDAYRQVWQLLYAQLDLLPEDEQQLITAIFLQRVQGLARFVELADMVIDTISELAQKPSTDKKQILANIIRILHYDGEQLPQHIRQHWEQLREMLVGSDFSSRMKRYVGMDLLEDGFNEHGNRVDHVRLRIEELAQQVIEDPQLLATEIPWLVTAEAQNGYRFGYELGRRDTAFSLLPILLDAQRQAGRNANAFFLSGYFRVLFDDDRHQWEEQSDLLAEDKTLRVWLPELTWQSGLTDRAGLRLLTLAEENAINVGQLRFFGAGRMIQDLAEGIFRRWIRFLLSSPHPYALPVALDLYYIYYVDRESSHKLPQQETLTILTHRSWIEPVEGVRFDPMDYHHWAEVGKAFAQAYHEESRLLATWMLEHSGKRGTILDPFSETVSVLSQITERSPQEIWPMITRYLGPPIDARAFHLRNWLRGEDDSISAQVLGMLSHIPLELVWAWVDGDIEQRARYLASFVPKSLFRGVGCLAREVLIRYGERNDVRQAFSANYFTGSWGGPESIHYESVKRKLLDFQSEEENQNVKRWIDEYVDELDKHIERAKILEERDAF